jgi:hypothetical protein
MPEAFNFKTHNKSLNAEAIPETKLAASIAVGLLNRLYNKPIAVALNSPNDWKWVNNIRQGNELGAARWVASSPSDIIAYAVAVGETLSKRPYIIPGYVLAVLSLSLSFSGLGASKEACVR